MASGKPDRRRTGCRLMGDKQSLTIQLARDNHMVTRTTKDSNNTELWFYKRRQWVHTQIVKRSRRSYVHLD